MKVVNSKTVDKCLKLRRDGHPKGKKCNYGFWEANAPYFQMISNIDQSSWNICNNFLNTDITKHTSTSNNAKHKSLIIIGSICSGKCYSACEQIICEHAKFESL